MNQKLQSIFDQDIGHIFNYRRLLKYPPNRFEGESIKESLKGTVFEGPSMGVYGHMYEFHFNADGTFLYNRKSVDIDNDSVSWIANKGTWSFKNRKFRERVAVTYTIGAGPLKGKQKTKTYAVKINFERDGSMTFVLVPGHRANKLDISPYIEMREYADECSA